VYTACDKFEGARKGFVFKGGASGLGYYKDSDGAEDDESEEDVPIKTSSTRIAIVDGDDESDHF
jgi:hypothetical protein